MNKNAAIIVKFRNHKYAQDWAEFVSLRYKPQVVEDISKEIREYPAYWYQNKICYAKDEDVYEYDWDSYTETKILGIAMVIKTTEGERVQSFTPK